MKKFCLVTTLILIIALSASCLVGCDKIKSDDVQGEWFLEQGKLEISGDAAKLNGEEVEYSFDGKNAKMTVAGVEYAFGDDNKSIYSVKSKAQCMTKPAKRDSFTAGEGFSYVDSQGRLCTIGFLSSDRVSITYVGQGGSFSDADIGEGTYAYSGGVLTVLADFTFSGQKVLFYYIDKNIDLFTVAGVRTVADFAKEDYDKLTGGDDGEDSGQQNSFKLEYKAGNGGRIEGESTQYVTEKGSGSAVTAVANTGYRFIGWSDGVTSASRRDTNVIANLTVTAKFEMIAHTVTYIAGENGRIIGNLNQTVAEGTSGTTVSASPDEGYVFVGWSDGVKSVSRKEENVFSDITVTAYFAKAVTITYEAALGGSIQGEAVQKIGIGEEASPVLAVADDGYIFAGWSDGWPLALRTDTGEKDVTYKAFFAETEKVVVRYEAGEGGRIEGYAVQQVDIGKDAFSVTAVADAGYVFATWSDGVLTATRTDKVVTNSISVKAVFVKTAESIVTIDYGDGQTFKVVLSKGDKINFPIPERAGYRFLYFSTPQGNVMNGEIWQQDYDCEVTAVWEKITYTVMLNAGAGQVSESSVSYTVDDLPLKLPLASHETLIFNGWKSPDGVYIDEITLENYGDIYLVAQYGDINDRLLYTLDQSGKGYVVTGYEGTDGRINVPAEKDGLPVVGIADYAFSNKSYVTSFKGGKNLVSIGQYAFYGCVNLTSADLGGCSALTEIGTYAFGGCAKLETISLQGCSALEDIGISAFSGAKAETLDFKETPSLKRIGSFAFQGCRLTKVDLSGMQYLETVELGAFSCDTLKEVYINDCPSLTTLSPAFENCKNIDVAELRNCTALTTLKAAFKSATVGTLDITGTHITYPFTGDLSLTMYVNTLYFDDVRLLNEMDGSTPFLLGSAQKVALANVENFYNPYFTSNFEDTGETEVRNSVTYKIYQRKAQ